MYERNHAHLEEISQHLLGITRATIGTDIPSFDCRTPGDIHYDQPTGRTLVLKGALGTSFRDNFNQKDGPKDYYSGGQPHNFLSESLYPGGGAITVDERELAFGVNGGGYVVQVGSGAQIIAATFPGGIYGGFEQEDLLLRSNSNGSGYIIQIRQNGVRLAVGDAASNVLLHTFSTGNPGYDRFAAQVDTSNTAPTISVWRNDILLGTYTDESGSPALGSYVGVAGKDTRVGLVDGAALGSLRWVYNEPLYLSCVVAGEVAVATHIFKPGLRIPTGPTTVRRMIVRVDIAPGGSGGGFTVVGHRYNNGVDTGDSISVTVNAGDNVAVTNATVDTAQGDMWKFDVTSVNGTPASDMLINLDCF
jgi:hypothetical protein